MLMLIRHGQASFGEADYDRLSDLGQRQATRLGEWVTQQGWHFDAIYSGQKRRQQHSAQLIAQAGALRHGGDLHTGTLPEFNEIDAEGIFAWFLANRSDVTDAQRAQLAAPKTYPDLYVNMFKLAINAWLRGELSVPGVPTWESFRVAVHDRLRTIHAQHAPEERLAIVTSGGPMSAAITAVEDQLIADGLLWEIPNTGLLHFARDEGRLRARPVMADNKTTGAGRYHFATPHLDQHECSYL